jgi:hypothetical protein
LIKIVDHAQGWRGVEDPGASFGALRRPDAWTQARSFSLKSRHLISAPAFGEQQVSG